MRVTAVNVRSDQRRSALLGEAGKVYSRQPGEDASLATSTGLRAFPVFETICCAGRELRKLLQME